MVDGRDSVVIDRILGSCVAGAAAFADSEMMVLKGKMGDTEITVLFEEGSYEWSNPAAGGVFPVRPVKSFFLGVQTEDHQAKFCGYIARDFELVAMDADRNPLDHYVLNEVELYQQHP